MHLDILGEKKKKKQASTDKNKLQVRGYRKERTWTREQHSDGSTSSSWGLIQGLAF